MIAALLLASVVAQTPVDAERAFAADAQRIGQWAAFRKWATADATMFAPGPVKTQEFLKDRKDPPKAIDWWPTASWISCDGTLAVNTGGWQRPDGAVGYFTTVWQKQADGGWKWIVDGGDALEASRPRPKDVSVKRADCKPVQPLQQEDEPLIIWEGDQAKHGMSADQSVVWRWDYSASGDRAFTASIWDGSFYRNIVSDKSPSRK